MVELVQTERFDTKEFSVYLCCCNAIDHQELFSTSREALWCEQRLGLWWLVLLLSSPCSSPAAFGAAGSGGTAPSVVGEVLAWGGGVAAVGAAFVGRVVLSGAGLGFLTLTLLRTKVIGS